MDLVNGQMGTKSNGLSIPEGGRISEKTTFHGLSLLIRKFFPEFNKKLSDLGVIIDGKVDSNRLKHLLEGGQGAEIIISRSKLINQIKEITDLYSLILKKSGFADEELLNIYKVLDQINLLIHPNLQIKSQTPNQTLQPPSIAKVVNPQLISAYQSAHKLAKKQHDLKLEELRGLNKLRPLSALVEQKTQALNSSFILYLSLNTPEVEKEIVRLTHLHNLDVRSNTNYGTPLEGSRYIYNLMMFLLKENFIVINNRQLPTLDNEKKSYLLNNFQLKNSQLEKIVLIIHKIFLTTPQAFRLKNQNPINKANNN